MIRLPGCGAAGPWFARFVQNGTGAQTNAVRVTAEDAEGRKKLAGYMLRAPMSLEKMTYDAATGTVI